MILPLSAGPQGHALRRWLQTSVAIALPALLLSSVHADQLIVNNLTYNDVRITAVRDGEIFFSITSSGNETHKPLAHVSRITLTDEPAFNTAEEAYAAKQWDRATEGYEKTLRTTQKPWLKEWVSLRLLESANHGGRFDAAIKAYLALAEKSPDSVRSIKLLMPQPDSAYLKEGIKLVTAALDRNPKPPTKDLLLSLLVDLHKARNDLKAANEVLTKQLELKAAAPNSPEAARASITLKLNAIRLALLNKDYDKTIQLAEKDAPTFADPADQAEALYCLAEAKAAMLGNSKTPDAWKEVALAYMQVVASCPPSAPHVPDALMKTAAIHESYLNEKDTALRIYEQVISEYKGQPAAKDAEKQAQRLKG